MIKGGGIILFGKGKIIRGIAGAFVLIGKDNKAAGIYFVGNNNAFSYIAVTDFFKHYIQ